MAEIKGIVQQRMPYGIAAADESKGHHCRNLPRNPIYAGNWFHVDGGHPVGSGVIRPQKYKLGVKKVGYKDNTGNKEDGTNANGSLNDGHGYTSHIFKKDSLTGNHFYIRNKYAYHGIGGDLTHNYQALESGGASNISGRWWTPAPALQLNQDSRCSNAPRQDGMCTACSTIDDNLCDLNIDKSNKCIGYNHGDPNDDSYQGGRNTDNDKYCMSGYKEVESQHGKERADAWCMAGGSSEWVDHRFSIRDNKGNLINNVLKNRKCLLDSGDKEWECLNEDGSEGNTPITSGNNKNKTCKQIGNEYRTEAGMFYAKILCDKTSECKSKRNHVMCNKSGGVDTPHDISKDDSCESEFNTKKENNHYKTLEEEEEACRSIDGCSPYRSSFKTVGRVWSYSGSAHKMKGCGRVISALENDSTKASGTEDAANWSYGSYGNAKLDKGAWDNTSLYVKRYDGANCRLTFDGTRTTNNDEKASEFYDYYKSKNDYLLKAKETTLSDTSFEKHNDLGPWNKGIKAFIKGGKLECKYNESDFDPDDPDTLDRIKEFKRKFPSSQGCILDKDKNINISCTNAGTLNSPSTTEACKKYLECLGTTDGEKLKEDGSNKCYVSEDERSCVDKNNQPASKCHLYPDVKSFDDFADQYVFRDKYDDEEIKRNTENFDIIMSKYCGKEKHDGKFCINGESKCSRFLESNTQGGPLNDVGHFCYQWQRELNQDGCHDEDGVPRENSRLNKLYESRGVKVLGHDNVSSKIASNNNDRNGYCDLNPDAKECFCSNPDNDDLWKKADSAYKTPINLKNRGCWYTRCDINDSNPDGSTGKYNGNWVPPIPGIENVNKDIHCPDICAITQNAKINISGDANLTSSQKGEIDAFNNKLSATCNMTSDGSTSTQSKNDTSNPVTNPNSGGGNVGGNVTQTVKKDDSFIEKHKLLLGVSTLCIFFAIIMMLIFMIN